MCIYTGIDVHSSKILSIYEILCLSLARFCATCFLIVRKILIFLGIIPQITNIKN